ncbi:MAG TPA: ABC transporter substrate-binding protein, partial [Chloroflexota bacterium]|nr:ABC transporter substrate-binding protein [Chloroflexota bacterium]
MANRFTAVPLILLSCILLAATACSSAAPAPAPTKAPDKPAAAASTSVPAAPAAAPAATQAAPAAAKPAASGGQILIGVDLPVTGSSASEGPFVRKAVNLAAKQVNAAGGINGKQLKLIEQDIQSTNPGALAALNKSVEEDKVLAIIGPIKSTMIQAMDDTVRKYGVPVMIGGTNATLTKKGNPWLFRCRPDDSIAAYAMVKYVKEDLKVTKIGILHDTDAFGTGGADLIEQYSKEMGTTVVKRESYTTKDKDYTAQLLSLKNAGAEIMLLYGTNPDDVAVIQRQYRQLGVPYKYLGSPSSASKDTMNLSKEASDGLLAIQDYVPGASPESAKYVQDYKKEYNEDFDSLFTWNYDAINVLATAIKTSGEDKAKLRESILAIKGYKGALGGFSF